MGVIQPIHNCKGKVFLSHKQEDAQFARELGEQIRARAGERTAIMMSGDIPAGGNWYQEAKARIKDAKWFVLIMRNGAASLDWSLYEAGIYRALTGDNGRLVCLHDPDVKPPEHLSSQCQSVECTPERLEAFVAQLACTP